MDLLTVKDAAARLHITPALLCRYCRQGRLGRRIGHQWLITDAELEAFSAKERQAGKPHKETVYRVEGLASFFLVKAPRKTRAYSEGVKEFGRGNTQSVRRATPEEIENYTVQKGEIESV